MSNGIMTLLIILGVTEILCNFRSALDWKEGRKMYESLKKDFLIELCLITYKLALQDNLIEVK